MTESQHYVHTSTGSKAVVYTFIATFIVCLFLFNNTVSLFTGVVFVFVGILTVSVVVAMPFYFYKKRRPEMSAIVLKIEFLTTIFLTVVCFCYFFTNPLDFTTSTDLSNNDNAYIVRCDEPIPAFTLDMDSTPNKMQRDAICACTWKALSPSDKNLSAFLTRNERHNTSEAQLELFAYRLDLATGSCSTKNL